MFTPIVVGTIQMFVINSYETLVSRTFISYKLCQGVNGIKFKPISQQNLIIKEGSSIIRLVFTLSDIERSKSRSLRFRSLISRKRAELRHMLLSSINRNHIYGKFNGTIPCAPLKVNVTQISKT